MNKEPIIHSHLTNTLPENHPLRYKDVYCDKCGKMLHSKNNECMQTWLETEKGNFCTRCFPLRPVLKWNDELRVLKTLKVWRYPCDVLVKNEYGKIKLESLYSEKKLLEKERRGWCGCGQHCDPQLVLIDVIEVQRKSFRGLEEEVKK